MPTPSDKATEPDVGEVGMVEKVAARMAEALRGAPNYVEAENLSSATIDGCFDLKAVAHAVIAAMMEPTAGMLLAGADRAAETEDCSTGYMAEESYAAMIQAALDEGEG